MIPQQPEGLYKPVTKVVTKSMWLMNTQVPWDKAEDEEVSAFHGPMQLGKPIWCKVAIIFCGLMR